MKNFRGTKKQFVVTDCSGRRVAEGDSMEHVEPVALKGRKRDVWSRNKDGVGYRLYRSY